ncbi:MAG: hypothetical protein AB9872_07875 [Solidesulfovibrio sp.]
MDGPGRIGPRTEHLVEEATASKDGSFAWIPVADVVETAGDFRVTLELPGRGRART